MKLRDLLGYEKIVIQCHDNPDADAIASGFGVYKYFKKMGKRDVRFVYSGRYQIQKSNLLLMIEQLEIPIDYVTNLETPDLLIMVDCQYGQGNVKRFDAGQVVVIDHHQISGALPELADVRSRQGSCASIVWDLLEEEGMDVNGDEVLATALYYGLMTDTNNFTELTQELDRQIRDEANYDQNMIIKFRNANISLDELSIAGQALLNYDYNPKTRLALVGAEPCDPNILGLISDLVLEVDVVDYTLVYSILPFGIKFSVRSCVPSELPANIFAEALAKGIGSGGGHKIKAGGFIQKELFEPEFQKFVEINDGHMDAIVHEDGTYEIDWTSQFLRDRMEKYIEERLHCIYKNKKAVVFDLDGTLLETLEDLYLAVNAALKKYNMPERTMEEVRMSVGNGVKKLMERSVPKGEFHPDFEACFAYFKEYYADHCEEHTAPYDGIIDMLKAVKEQGYKTAIVSNKFDPAVKILKDELFEGLIDVAIGEQPGYKKKPSKDMVMLALNELNVSGDEAIYVGDSDVDLDTAKNSNLPCVAVTWGFRGSEFLAEHGAKVMIDEPMQLLTLID